MTWLADIIICTPDRFLLLYKETLLLFCIFLPHYTPCGTQLMPFVDLLTTKLGDFDSFIYKLKQYRHLKNSKRSPFSNSCRHIPICVCTLFIGCDQVCFRFTAKLLQTLGVNPIKKIRSLK